MPACTNLYAFIRAKKKSAPAGVSGWFVLFDNISAGLEGIVYALNSVGRSAAAGPINIATGSADLVFYVQDGISMDLWAGQVIVITMPLSSDFVNSLEK